MDEAMKIMRDSKVRRLPVLNDKGALVGIVSERDLLYASPSPATSLSIHELHYLISKIVVADVMTTEVITVTEDTPLEEAARIMSDNKIGGLPVVSNGKLVGIITETDLFKIFLELLGAREMGVRLTMLVPDEKGDYQSPGRGREGLGEGHGALSYGNGGRPNVRGVPVKDEKCMKLNREEGVSSQAIRESMLQLFAP